MAKLKFIVWGSAGYYDTGNELDNSIVGPFGFARANDARRSADVMAKACEAHVDKQADRVDSSASLQWDGPFQWYVATLQLPKGIEWDGVHPFGALKANCAKRAEKDPDFLEEFIDQCELDVAGGQRDEQGEGEYDDAYDAAKESLYGELG